MRLEIAEYYNSVRRCDDTVGRLLDVLDEMGVAENTLVMFLSDNGMAFPFAKTNCYLNSTRTPWVVRWPAVVQAGRVDAKHFIVGDRLPAYGAGCNRRGYSRRRQWQITFAGVTRVKSRLDA